MNRSGFPMKSTKTIALALLVLIAAAYIPLILQQNDFRTDDYYLLTLVKEHGLVHPFDGRHYGFYSAFRVLPMLTFLADYSMHGGSPFGYYLTNLLIHSIAVILLFLLLQEVFRRFFSQEGVLVPFLLALIAAFHADLFYNVLWISNRTESLLLVFHLLAMYAALRWFGERRRAWYALTLGATLLALLSKEQAMHLPLLYVVVGLVFARRGDGALPVRTVLLTAIPLFIAAGAFFLLRVFHDPAANVMIGAFSPRKLFSSVGIFLIALQPSAAAPLFDYFVAHKIVAAGAGLLLASGVVAWYRRLSPERRRGVGVLVILAITIMLPRVFYHVLPRINSVQVVFILLAMGMMVLSWKPRWSALFLTVWLAGQVISTALILPRFHHETSNDRYHRLLDEERDTGPRRYCLVTWYHNFGAYAMHYLRYGTFGQDTSMYRTPLFIDRRYGSKPGPEYTVTAQDGLWIFDSVDPRSVLQEDPEIPVPRGISVRMEDPAEDYGFRRAAVTLPPLRERTVYLIERDFDYEKLMQ